MKGVLLGLGLWLGLVGTAMAMSELDGHYHGSHDNQPVNAVLETMSTTVTGVLTIGKKKYLLQAEASDGIYKGRLSSMTTGEIIPFQFNIADNGISVEIHQAGNGAMRFPLLHD